MQMPKNRADIKACRTPQHGLPQYFAYSHNIEDPGWPSDWEAFFLRKKYFFLKSRRLTN